MANRVQKIADGVFGAETSVGIGLGMSLPLRMTILQDGAGLTLISPIPLDDELKAELAALGEVHSLVAPNRLHHLYLAAAQRAYPQARLLGAPGVAEKEPDLKFDAILSTGPLSPHLSALLVEGASKLSEVVVFHEPSKTLIVTDLVFNISSASAVTRFLLKSLSGAYGKVEQSRLLRALTDDRAAAARSIEALLSYSFERVVPAHGDVVQRGAQEQLSAGLWWMRGESRRSTASI